MSDPVQEWFPTLTNQHSQTTLQGLEWTLDAQFNARLEDLVALQACPNLVCVETWSARTGLTYDYLWVNKFPADNSSEVARRLREVLADLNHSPSYRLIHESESAAIFERIK